MTIPALTFPTIIDTADDIIKAKELDKANGLDAEVLNYGTPAAQSADIAKGELLVGVQTPFQIAKMRLEGVPVVILGTFVGMQDTQIITKKPEIKTFMDLKGHTLAATVGFSAYQYLSIYTKQLGIKLGTDILVVDASTSLAQAQLEADRVDAIQVWEPSSTRVLKQNPDARVIQTGDEAWRQITGGPGWDIVLFANADWGKQNPGGLTRVLKMYQAYGDFMNQHPDEADAIISSGKYASKGIPPGIIAAGIAGKRLVVDVKPAWDPEANKEIWTMLNIGVKDGFIASADKAAVANSDPDK